MIGTIVTGHNHVYWQNIRHNKPQEIVINMKRHRLGSIHVAYQESNICYLCVNCLSEYSWLLVLTVLQQAFTQSVDNFLCWLWDGFKCSQRTRQKCYI